VIQHAGFSLCGIITYFNTLRTGTLNI
jgi:hypothetical protein